MNKIIKVDSLTKKIKSAVVLDNVNASFEYGQITGLRGVNGSGKTMLLREISGLISASSGSVTIDGEVLGKDIEFPKSIGLLIENPAFLDDCSAFENLKILASIKNLVSDDDIRAVIDLVGLTDAGKKKYKKYSLGMKQRLGLAAVIFEKPEITLFDEPTNALDDDGYKLLIEIIKEQKQRGAAVIVASHDARFLDAISDKIYCMEAGRIVETIVK